MTLMRKFLVSALLSLPLLLGSLSFLPVSASATVDPLCDKSAYFLGLPSWYAYLDVGMKDDGKCDVIGPSNDGGATLDWQKAIPLIGLAVLELLLRLAGLISVVFVMYGGFRYITSQGEPDKTKSSRQTITSAFIGVVISIVAAAAVSFIANTLTTK